jgi:hypothetical protein
MGNPVGHHELEPGERLGQLVERVINSSLHSWRHYPPTRLGNKDFRAALEMSGVG